MMPATAGHSAGEEAGDDAKHGDLLPGQNFYRHPSDVGTEMCWVGPWGARTTPVSSSRGAAKLIKVRYQK